MRDVITTVSPYGVKLQECQMLDSFLISPIFWLIFRSVMLPISLILYDIPNMSNEHVHSKP